MVAEEIARRLAAAAAVDVIKEVGVQVFVVQPGVQGATVLAQVGDGGGFIGKQIAQGQGVLLQISDDAAHAVRHAAGWRPPVASGASLFWGSGNRAGWHRKYRSCHRSAGIGSAPIV